MRMRSTTGQEIYIALTSGNSVVIGTDYREVPKEFRREALMLVGESIEIEGIKTEDINHEPKPADNPEKYLVETIKKMIEESKTDEKTSNFTASGLPNLNTLRSKAGYNVNKEEMLVAWYLIQKELKTDDEETIE